MHRDGKVRNSSKFSRLSIDVEKCRHYRQMMTCHVIYIYVDIESVIHVEDMSTLDMSKCKPCIVHAILIERFQKQPGCTKAAKKMTSAWRARHARTVEVLRAFQ